MIVIISEKLSAAVEAVRGIAKKIGSVSAAKKTTLIFMSALLACSLFIGVSGMTGAFEVTYQNGDKIYVKTVSEFEAALKEAVEHIHCDNAEDYISEPVYNATLAFPRDIASGDKLVEEILSSTNGLIRATALMVNNEQLAVVESAFAEKAVLDTLEQYCWSVDDKVSFVDDVQMLCGYYPAEAIVSADAVIDTLSNLDVKTVTTVTREKAVAFSTVKKLSSSVASGKSVVSQKGVNGLARVTEEVTYINGTETGRNTVSSTTLTKPVSQIVTVGTKIQYVNKKASQSKENANKLGFVWPTTRTGTIVTSYWGDGRNHKGMDIAGKVGTPIYASKAGTVIKSTRTHDYGIYVEIDHGNGYVTRYAHCSAIVVKVGQKVATGENIALMGNTGRSTGPHVHFEVIKNGTRVDPSAYIGRR